MPEASLHKASLQAHTSRASELESIISLPELINKAKNPLLFGLTHEISIYLSSKVAVDTDRATG